MNECPHQYCCPASTTTSVYDEKRTHTGKKHTYDHLAPRTDGPPLAHCTGTSGVDVTPSVGYVARGTSSIVKLVGNRLAALALFSFILDRHAYVYFRALSMSVVSPNALVMILEYNGAYACKTVA